MLVTYMLHFIVLYVILLAHAAEQDHVVENDHVTPGELAQNAVCSQKEHQNR